MLSATRATRLAEWAAPDRLFTTRGQVGALAFAPDGLHLAYENTRVWREDRTPEDTWQYIGVYDLPTHRINYVDPSFDIDSDPVWSVDGTQITFTRHVEGLEDVQLTRPVRRLALGAYQPPPQRADEAFTLASVLATPYVYPLVPARDGRSLAYISREAGPVSYTHLTLPTNREV